MRTTTWLAIATMVLLSACGGGGDGGVVLQRSEGAVQFDAAAETLRLPTLQSGANAYQDVVLRLARDGSWQLESVGALRLLDAGERMDAVLQAPEGTVLAPGLRPTVATITVARLHIGARLYANVPLQFAGSTWFWGQALQAGSDTQDLHEVKALTAADFRANASLAATDSHHTVLHSSADTGTQRFPLQLQDQRYRFCMDRQPEGADRIRLLDPNGAAVLTLHAGDACVEQVLSAGRYTMEHEYGGLGVPRTIFVRPARSAEMATSALRTLRATSDGVPEYWAIHVAGTDTHSQGFLSFNDAETDAHKPCNGFIDAAAQLDVSARPGQWGSTNYLKLFETRNFFEVLAGGASPLLGYPLYCTQKGLNGSRYALVGSVIGALPSAITPAATVYPFATDGLQLVPGDDGTFELYAHCGSSWDCFLTGSLRLGFPFGSIMAPATLADVQFTSVGYTALNFYGLQKIWYDAPKQRFTAPLRYFPSGLPASMRDASGSWVLQEGEVALFGAANCSGPAVLTKHQGTLRPPDSAFDGKSFKGSLQLGPNTVATFSDGSGTGVYNQSGCIASTGSGDFARWLTLSVTKQIDIQTNSCEYCNLTGLDFSGQATALRGVKLQHANLTGAHLQKSDLSKADLRSAILQGAWLTQANLEQANLCGATLNGQQLPSGVSGPAAQLGGAHLKNANLAGANLDGADFSNASFYGSAPGACVSAACGSYALPTCASAVGATANNASFAGAYLANADFTGVKATGADFSRAILFGTRLVNANLTRSASTGKIVSFASTLLNGADLTNASLDYASFLGASVDASAGNDCMQINLAQDYLKFPGFTVPPTAPATKCVVPSTLPAQACVRASYGAHVTPVQTNNTNVCPDNSAPPCMPTSWLTVAKNTSTCAAAAPLCGNPFQSTENTCWR